MNRSVYDYDRHSMEWNVYSLVLNETLGMEYTPSTVEDDVVYTSGVARDVESKLDDFITYQYQLWT